MITYRWNTWRKGMGGIDCPNLLNWRAIGAGLSLLPLADFEGAGGAWSPGLASGLSAYCFVTPGKRVLALGGWG
jgi:hypothetical protein